MRVLLVEDHPTMRLGLKSILEVQKDMEVIGEAENVVEALDYARDRLPDLVLLDLRLKGDRDGLELCREIKELAEPPRVLIYTAFNSSAQMLSAMLAGADGFVHKSMDHRSLPNAMRAIYSGKALWLTEEDGEYEEHQPGSLPGDDMLTPREVEVASLVVRRHTNAEIAEDLRVSLPTVKSHVGNVLKKLGLESRRELARKFSLPR